MRASEPAALRRLQELKRELSTWVEGQPPALSWLIPSLQMLLGCEAAIACSYAPNENGIYLPWAYVDGVRSDFVDLANRCFEGRGVDVTAFDPLHPAQEQRNAVFTLEELAKRFGIDHKALPVWSLYESAGLGELEQMRVLACDRSLLMAYVGVMQESPFTAQQRNLFTDLTQSLIRRLKLESRLDAVNSHGAVLEAALSQIPAPAFVLDAWGRVLETNSSGHVWLEQLGAEGRVLLAASVKEPGTQGFQALEVAAAGCAKRYLVIEKSSAASPRSTELAAQHWGFTRRETEVLHLLEDGLSNRSLAAHLGVAARTVEAHLTAMFEKAQVESRSELIARALRHRRDMR